MKKIALITGITGQDGSYLAEQLLEKNYIVHGIIRRSSNLNTQRIDHLYNGSLKSNLHLHHGDMTDTCCINRLLADIQPDEVYNLAAQSHVKVSFDIPEYTAQVDALGTLRFLESIRQNGLKNKTKIYQASTSELYGLVQETPQTEKTPFHPRSPYGVAKMYGYWCVINYREAYDLHASNGILFNHESPRRGETFVTRKITKAVSRIKYGVQDELTLGNLNSLRDWGYAPEYTDMMWRMLQQETPGDYVCATGVTETVRTFCIHAFNAAGIDIEFVGEGVDEVGIDKSSNKILLRVSPKHFRPAEVDLLVGNPHKAFVELGWKSTTSLKQLVQLMVDSDIESTRREIGY